MKKCLLLFLCLFLFTGCSITYNLDLDKPEEVITVVDTFGSGNDNLFDSYSKKPIPLSKLAPLLSESDKREKGISYYDTSNLSQGNEMSLKFTGKYGKSDSISNSSMVSYATRDGKIGQKGDKIIVEALRNMKIFDQFDDLDELVINVKCSKKVIESNADKVNGNVYTWVFTRDNYINKTLNIEFSKTSVDNPMIKFTITISVIVVIGLLIFLFIRNKNKKTDVL